MLKTADLEYDLPESLIATTPAQPRDTARLMVVSRSDPAVLEHAAVHDLPTFLDAGDVAIFNRTRVLRARLIGQRIDTGGRVEGLFLDVADQDQSSDGRPIWRVLLRSNGRLREGMRISLLNNDETTHGAEITLLGKEQESWRVAVEPAGDSPSVDLERIGRTPLPPYILKARQTRGSSPPDQADRSHYQTVFAAESADAGSVAAPTAGLHFTPDLLDLMDHAGVGRLHVDLRVGYGTFAPVQADTVEDHPIHAEWCAAPSDVIRAIEARTARTLAIGTTTARTLESIPAPLEQWRDSGWADWTRLLITPGYQWKQVDALMTNFHLPRSTLLAMVAALFPDGVERLLDLYRIAVEEQYRFYSYGDAMLILP